VEKRDVDGNENYRKTIGIQTRQTLNFNKKINVFT